MAITVVVSGNSPGGVSVVPDADPIELSVVQGGDAVAMSVTGGVGPGAPEIGPNFIVGGSNITVTTASGQYVVSGPSTTSIANLSPVQAVQGRTGNVVLVAGDITSGVFDVARIPVLPSQTQVVSSGDLAALTSSQQSSIVSGTIVTTTDGKRWVYSGSGSKTSPGSYVELADVTPDWSVITSKPTTFLPTSHTHETSEITGLVAAIQQYGNVTSVQGKTGVVVLSAADITAAAATHSHPYVTSVNSRTGGISIVAGVNITVSESSGTLTIAAGDTLPQQGGNATKVLSTDGTSAVWATRLSIAETPHTHAVASVTDLTTVANVVSVQGKTGTVVLAHTDITAAAASHTHAVASVTDLTTVANVVSVQGKTGTVVLAHTDVTAAAASHTHNYVTLLNGQTGQVSITAGPNVTVSTAAGSVTISSGDTLPSQPSNGGKVLATDGTAATWVSRYSLIEPVIQAGGGIAMTKDAASGQITIESLGGIVGNTAASVSTKTLASVENDYDAGVADIVRLSPSSAVTLTGLVGGVDGVVRVLYNVGTNVVTLAANSTASQQANRFEIISGNVSLQAGDSASVWYDGTSQRWRVLEDQSSGVSGGGVVSGSGGGIAMSYLFG